MSLTTIALILLGAVDVAALSIGISIRRKVTGIVTQTAANIEAAVKEGIAEAVANLGALAVQLMRSDRHEAAEKVKELLDQLT